MMLDDEDIDFMILAWPSGGWIVALVGLVAIVIMCAVVSGNKKECAESHCSHGSGMLVEHECVCVEKPEPRK